MSRDFEGKVAFVTGAARGQGRSHTVRLAEEGADIIAIDLCGDISDVPYPLATRADLDETVRQVEALGRSIVARVADVRDFNSIACALRAGVAELGGTWRTAKVPIPYLGRQGTGGSIVPTSSAAGLKGYANIAHFTAAKHGINGLMKTLAQELSGHHVRVNTVNPTRVDTAMIMNGSMYRLFCPDIDNNPTCDDFAPVSQAMNALPMPWVESRDVSNSVLFLLSNKSRYITGVALPVDAGMLIK